MKISQILLITMSSFSSLMARVIPEVDLLIHPPVNPPVWPASVFVDPTQAQINAVFSTQGGQSPPNNGQFVDTRYAFLFTPKTHNVTVNVGYYTTVMGMGASPADTIIQTVNCSDGSNTVQGGALDNFWRSAENFTTTPSTAAWPGGPIGMAWSVSQACPLRRVNVNGDLYLFQVVGTQGAYASGGFMADCNVSGTITSGSQQQWFTRNTSMGGWSNSVWNMVFVGCTGNVPATNCGSYTNVAKTPRIAEKPFITYNNGLYYLNLPNPETNKVGPTSNYSNVTTVNFSDVYVAVAGVDNETTINAAISSGYHVVLTPGIYNLKGFIDANKKGVCILGIGFPTLISTNGAPCIIVGIEKGSANQPGAAGTVIAGILLQAGPMPTPQLLLWKSEVDNGLLQDCFARVGGPTNSQITQVQTDIMVEIDDANIICDNAWLWRADHDIGGLVTGGANPCNTGLLVNGANVITYGLAVEHTLQDLTQWNGNNGACYFYQSEFPYDVTSAYGTAGYAAYRVGPKVTNFQGFGIAAYSYFRDFTVFVPSGIVTPLAPGINFTNSLTRYLNGNGGIENVIDTFGGPVSASNPGPAYFCGPLPTN
jgi:hypothetical protein